jgi:ribosomal peptide maturation radical SAM protein 1
MKRVLLITMPFSFANTPALSLTLLKGALQQRGIPCDIRYLQLPFAGQIGKDLYYRIAQFAPRTLVGEWIFAHHLFAGQLPDPQAYIDDILLTTGEVSDQEFIDRLPWLRDLTGEYLEHCMQSVPWKDYDVVGFTSTFAQNLASLALAKRIKEEFPQKIIIFGGANCEDEMGVEMLRQFPFVDFIFSGEADRLLPATLDRLETHQDFDNLIGLIYRKNGEVVANGRYAPPIFDLDTLPFPDFDDYFEQLIASGFELSPEEISLPMETSRGCWWGAKSHCTFCGLNDDTLVYRSKSEGRVLEEFAYLAERYPSYKRVDVVDKILDMRYFRQVVPGLIQRKLGLNIFYFVKANLTKDQVKMLKQAGIQRIQPGIESLDTGVLQLMRKGSSTVQNIQLLKWAAEVGLDTIWNFITGFPGEDPQAYHWMAEILPTLTHLQPPAGSSDLVRLDRFSPFFEDTQSFGMVNVRATAAYSYVYPFPRESLNRLAYFFDYSYADGRDPRQYTRILDQAVEHWYNLENPGVLLSLSGDGELRLYDTRPAGIQEEILLKGQGKVIYEFCDEARTFSAIIRHLAQLGVLPAHPDGVEPTEIDAEEVQDYLDWLVERRLMLHADDRYLSLAIPMDVPARAFIDLFVGQVEKEISEAI